MKSKGTTKFELAANLRRARRSIVRSLTLRSEVNLGEAEDDIRAGIELRNSGAWTLVFAIVVASVGLNVNSTAVVIGAMLISPLMGPVVGVGFSLGVYDFDLLKRCLRNLGVAVVISILTSALYFFLSPLSDVQSEILARTRPSFFDVLIALGGGAAGIVAIASRTKNNALHGAAIATALMPPLCTAGFALANGRIDYFSGAFFLFLINAVFIAISTFLFVQYLKFPKVISVDHRHKTYINKVITSIGFAFLIPSFIMAWYLERESAFHSQAQSFVQRELKDNRVVVIDHEEVFEIKNPVIKVTILGEWPEGIDEKFIRDRAKAYSLKPESIIFIQSKTFEKLRERARTEFNQSADRINQLTYELTLKSKALDAAATREKLFADVSKESAILFPGISRIFSIGGNRSDPNFDNIVVHWRQLPTKSELMRSRDFLRQRLGPDFICCENLKSL